MQQDIDAILAVEREAFNKWAAGDPSGFLDASDDDVAYFDPFLEKRLDGLAALRQYYESFAGQVKIDRWEMLDPRVMLSGDIAVLTFNFVSDTQGRHMRWNTTEVYRRRAGQWKIVHTHWSLTKPQLR